MQEAGLGVHCLHPGATQQPAASSHPFLPNASYSRAMLVDEVQQTVLCPLAPSL